MAPGLAEVGCGLVARSGKVCEKLCAGLLSESSIGMSKCWTNWGAWSTFGRRGRKNVRQTVARARSEQPRTKEVPQRGPSMKKNQQRSSSLTHLPAHSLTPLHSTPRHATPRHSTPLQATPLHSAPLCSIPSIHPSIHAFTNWFVDIHGFTDSLAHRFIESLVRWFIALCFIDHWFMDSLVPWFTESSTHWIVIDSLVQCFIDSSTR